ncbi:hypothetical protein EDD11_004441 [Mortierella claussenii]|nr:hypothetical protein EDD11_004441 [Mortierella claussenii]
MLNVGLCVESTLGVAQLSVQFALFTSIFALYMIYFPPYKKVNAIVHNLHLVCLPSRSFSWAISIFFAKIIVGNIIVSTIITLILLALVDDDLERHSVWTLLWAGFLGISSVLLAIVQYIPQIVETYLRKVSAQQSLQNSE